VNAKLRVQFDMSFDSAGEFKTEVTFTFPEHTDLPVPENVKALLIGEIKMLCGVMHAAKAELFTEKGGAR